MVSAAMLGALALPAAASANPVLAELGKTRVRVRSHSSGGFTWWACLLTVALICVIAFVIYWGSRKSDKD